MTLIFTIMFLFIETLLNTYLIDIFNSPLIVIMVVIGFFILGWLASVFAKLFLNSKTQKEEDENFNKTLTLLIVVSIIAIFVIAILA